MADFERRSRAVADAKRALVARMLASGILVEFTGNRRNRRFRYDAYVRLFSGA